MPIPTTTTTTLPPTQTLLEPFKSPYSADFTYTSKPSTAPNFLNAGSRRGKRPATTFAFHTNEFEALIGDVGARRLNTRDGSVGMRTEEIDNDPRKPIRSRERAPRVQTGSRQGSRQSNSRQNNSRSNSRQNISRQRSQSPSQPRAPRPSGQFPEFLDEVHFPNQLLYYDEAMTIPVTSRAPSKFHSDLNNRRICNTDASIDMSTYPTTNVELASIAASGNGPYAKSLLLPNNKDLSDHGFLLLNKYTNLTQLDIQGCSYLGDACAVLIRHSMPKMKHLDISETSITDVGIEDIMIGCRWISTLNIRDNQHFKDKGCGSVHQR